MTRFMMMFVLLFVACTPLPPQYIMQRPAASAEDALAIASDYATTRCRGLSIQLENDPDRDAKVSSTADGWEVVIHVERQLYPDTTRTVLIDNSSLTVLLIGGCP